jgi:hypothetical protein
MVTGIAALLTLALGAMTAGAAEIDLARWSRSLPTDFSLAGSKVEPTYMAAIDIRRDGDRIAVLGGAPAWMERSLEAVSVSADGVIRNVSCPKGMDCSATPHPSGFLATASLIAASRRGTLKGTVGTERFGTWQVACVDAALLNIPDPILDPCFEIHTGAAIAQKHRLSHRFDGPSLDPVTVRITTSDKSILSLKPKDKAS